MSANLLLGTAVFGLDYGVSNRAGRVPRQEVARILEAAAELGVGYLDTAPAYGVAERVLGQLSEFSSSFKIITKTPAIESKEDACSPENGIEATLSSTLSALGRTEVDVLMLHNPDRIPEVDRFAVCEELGRMVDMGLAKRLGVSIYDPSDLLDPSFRRCFQVVQLPINVLDQRYLETGTLAALKREGLEIHARSIFLQGLLLMPPDQLPDHFEPAGSLIEAFHEEARRNDLDPLAAALSFVASRPEIDGLVVGVETEFQLREISRLLGGAWPELPWANFACPDRRITDPRQWPRFR